MSSDPSPVSITGVTQLDSLNQDGANTYFTPGTINNANGTLKNVAGAITSPGETISTKILIILLI
jgi:hypothetical protein